MRVMLRMMLPEPLRKKMVDPILQLLRTGASPERLAWSLALGFVIGVNPLLGSTTVLALLLAPLFRLNIVASQVTNHLVYPLELILFPVFIKCGSLLFHTAALPMRGSEFLRQARAHPVETTRQLWTWEWHAMVVWAVAAAIVAPMLKMLFKPMLKRMVRDNAGVPHL